MLGDLPSLTGSGSKSNSSHLQKAVENALDEDGFGLSNVNRELLLKKNRMKKGKKMGKRGITAPPSTSSFPSDMPVEFLCELTHQPMSGALCEYIMILLKTTSKFKIENFNVNSYLIDPVETIYGNFYDRNAILAWMQQQVNVRALLLDTSLLLLNLFVYMTLYNLASLLPGSYLSRDRCSSIRI